MKCKKKKKLKQIKPGKQKHPAVGGCILCFLSHLKSPTVGGQAVKVAAAEHQRKCGVFVSLIETRCIDVDSVAMREVVKQLKIRTNTSELKEFGLEDVIEQV